MSSMTPTIIVNSITGRVRSVIGAAGGTKITTATAYVINKIIQQNIFYRI
jgi:gamma-glutamyltranspeptidase/glutathione hydrolase/leukotriene-C4 hydrolase